MGLWSHQVDKAQSQRDLDLMQSYGWPTTATEAAPPSSEQAIQAGKRLLDLSHLASEEGIGQSRSLSGRELRDCLDRHRESLDALASLLLAPEMAIKRDLDLGWGIAPMPDFAGMKLAVDALSERARIRATAGDLEGALGDLEAGRNAARLLGADPTFISILVAIAIEAKVLRMIGEACSTAKAPADFSGPALDLLRRTDFTLDRIHALKAELYVIVALLRNSMFVESVRRTEEGEPDISLTDPRRIGTPDSARERLILHHLIMLYEPLMRAEHEGALTERLFLRCWSKIDERGYPELTAELAMTGQPDRVAASALNHVNLEFARRRTDAWRAVIRTFLRRTADPASELEIDPFTEAPLKVRRNGAIYADDPVGLVELVSPPIRMS